MIQTPVPEVPEAQAEGAVKSIYEDIRRIFRVPLVHPVFRSLATQPDFLQIAWVALKPNLQTVYFERCADALRTLAVEATGALGQGPRPDNADDVRPTLHVLHYANPKVLLAVSALRSAANGEVPRLTELSGDDKRQIATGVPDGAVPIETIESEAADAQIGAIFDDIQATSDPPVVNMVYRALARWPAYLETSWESIKPMIERQEYRAAQRQLRRQADEAVMALPFRMDISSHVMRHAGLSEQQIDDVRDILNRYYGLLPALTVHVSALVTGVDTAEDAKRSPFPARLMM